MAVNVGGTNPWVFVNDQLCDNCPQVQFVVPNPGSLNRKDLICVTATSASGDAQTRNIFNTSTLQDVPTTVYNSFDTAGFLYVTGVATTGAASAPQAPSGYVALATIFAPSGTVAITSANISMVLLSPSVTVTSPTVPQGRLSLSATSPVTTGQTVANTSSIYYVPYNGYSVPVYNGTTFVQLTFSTATITLTTGTVASGSLYDIFVGASGGAPFFGIGPAWSTTGTRSIGIQQVQGIWTNAATLTLANGGNTLTCAGSQATYLGTFYAVAAGQTTWTYYASVGASGNAVAGLYNAYNQVRVPVAAQSSGPYSSISTGAYAALGPFNVLFVDGLGTMNADVLVSAITQVAITGIATGSSITFAPFFNSASTSASIAAAPAQLYVGITGISDGYSLIANGYGVPGLGINTGLNNIGVMATGQPANGYSLNNVVISAKLTM